MWNSQTWLHIQCGEVFKIPKATKWPSTEEWIKKMWAMCTIEYSSAIKRNEIGSFVEMWMDLETAIQNEISQRKMYRILYIHLESRKMVQMILFAK